MYFAVNLVRHLLLLVNLDHYKTGTVNINRPFPSLLEPLFKMSLSANVL